MLLAETATAMAQAVVVKGEIMAAIRAGCSQCRVVEYRSGPRQRGSGRRARYDRMHRAW